MKVISRSHCDLTVIDPQDFVNKFGDELVKLYAIKGDINDITWNAEEKRFEILNIYEAEVKDD